MTKSEIQPDLKSMNLAGTFVYPILIKNYKNCESNVNIDFQGDLLAYPILFDSFNQNKNVISLGRRDFKTGENLY